MTTTRPRHVDTPQALGERLRAARIAAGLTQGELAFPGCSVGYVSRIESGRRTPSLQVIRELAARLGLDERWLARGTTVDVESTALLLDADLALRLDDADEAERLYALARAASEATELQARVSAGLGQVAFRRGDARAAREALEDAFELDPALDDPAAAETLGRVYARLDDTAAAVALFRRWRRRATERGDATEAFRFSVLLGNALVDAGAFVEAAEVLQDVLASHAAGDPLALARVHWSQSRLHVMQGDGEGARRAAAKALTLLEVTEHSYYRARAHHLMAYAELEAGRAEEAQELLDRGLALLGPSPPPHDVAEFRLEQARARALTGDPDGALALASSAREILSLDAHSFDLARCDVELAEAFEAAGRLERARALFERAVGLVERAEGPSRYHVDAYTRFAAHLERHGDDERAMVFYKRAAIAAQRGPRYSPAHVVA